MARPIQFKREDVLAKAMEAFWDQGYSATSMAHLVEVTELKPGSLYAAFKSKEQIYIDALDYYGQRSLNQLDKTLGAAETPLEGIRNYFKRLAKNAAVPDARRSCFLVNTVLELSGQNDYVRDRAKQHLDLIESRFRKALEEAHANSELASDKNPEHLAAFLMSSIWGLRVLGSTVPTSERTEIVVNQLLQLLN